jgi:hypothetical protein
MGPPLLILMDDMDDFVNFYNMDEASVELCKKALAEAPPLSAAQIDVISTLFGMTPVDPPRLSP